MVYLFINTTQINNFITVHNNLQRAEYEVLTGKTVRRQCELSLLAQSTIIMKYKLKNTKNVKKTLVNNFKSHTNKTARPTKTKLKQKPYGQMMWIVVDINVAHKFNNFL